MFKWYGVGYNYISVSCYYLEQFRNSCIDLVWND